MAAIPYTTGLQLLLDARTVSGSDGDAIAAWADQSGQGNNAAQSNASYKPTLRTNVFGSNSAIRFASTQNMGGAFASFGTVNGFTLLMCVANLPTSQNGSGGAFGVSQAGANDSSFFLYLSSASGGTYLNGSLIHDSPLCPLVTASQSSTPFVFGHSASTTEKTQFINGCFFDGPLSASMPGSPTIYSLMDRLLGGSNSNTYTTKGDLFFVAFYNGKLSTANAEAVTNWMLTELGVRTAVSGGGLLRSPGMSGGINW